MKLMKELHELFFSKGISSLPCIELCHTVAKRKANVHRAYAMERYGDDFSSIKPME
ncbi:hypothetical protein D3C73_1440740 [compost metagenome]